MASSKSNSKTVDDSSIFLSQYKVILWKLYITTRRRFILTPICLISPLAMVAIFRFAFYEPIKPPATCATTNIIPIFITLDTYTSFGYLLHLLLIVNRLIGEKYHQQQTLLFVMGCKKSAYYLSNVTFDLIVTISMATYLSISLRFLLLVCSALPFILITYLLHAIQTIAFAYLFCYNCLHSKNSQPPSTWLTIFILLWTISKTFRIVMEFQLGTPSELISLFITIVNCMLPQPALYEAGKHVIMDKNLHVQDLFSFKDSTKIPLLPLGYMWSAQIISIVLYFLVSWWNLRDDHESGASASFEEDKTNNTTTNDQNIFSRTDTYLALDRTNMDSLINLSQLFKSDLLIEDEPKHLEHGIRVENASKTYPSRDRGGHPIRVVDNLSLSVYEGQITILLGHNGAGKTTLIELITGLLESESGNITIAGRQANIKANRYLARLSVGYCPQLSIVFPELTVEEHLKLFCGIKCVNSEQNRNFLIGSILHSARLQDKRNSLVAQLSGGMVRKLSLAIALVGDQHQVLILDEPSSGLDPESRESIWEIIRMYGRSKAILITTQHMEEADHLGDRIAIMSRGRIVCCGSSVFLKQLLGNGYIVRLALRPTLANLGTLESSRHAKIRHYMGELAKKCRLPQGESPHQDRLRNELRMLVRKISETIQQCDPREEVDDGQDITIALDSLNKVSYDRVSDTIPLLDYERLFYELEQSEQMLDIESFGIASSTMEDVFNNVSVMANICFGIGIPRFANRQLIPVFTGTRLNENSRILAIDPSSTIGGTSVQPIEFNLAPENRIDKSDLFRQHVRLTIDRHVITFWNNLNGYLGQRLLYFILVYFVMVIIVKVRSKQSIIVQQRVTTFTFYSTLPFFLAFMASHYIHLSNRDKVMDSSKFLQHMAGLSPTVYWVVQYLFDVPSMILNAVILILCIKWIDFTGPFTTNAYFTSSDIWLSMFLLVVGFSSASALISYSMSAYFDSSAMAMVAMAMYHSGTFFVASGAMIFKSYSDTSYHQYVRWATLLNPGFALVDGVRKYYDTANFYEGAVKNYTNTRDMLLDRVDNGTITIITTETATAASQLLQTTRMRPSYLERQRDYNVLNYKALTNLLNSIGSDSSTKSMLNRSVDRSKLFTMDTQQGIYINYASVLLWNLIGLLLVILDELDLNPVGALQYLYNLTERWCLRWCCCPAKVDSQRGPIGPVVSVDSSVERERARVNTMLENNPVKSASQRSYGILRKKAVLPLLANDLSKSYNEVMAVDSISLALNHEECLGLLGINGAGKTTTFAMISTKIRPDRGQLRCLGLCPQRQRRLYRKQIGYDPQTSVTFYDLTCRQTLSHMALLRGMAQAASTKAIDSILGAFDMEEHADKIIGQLSGGTKRKLSLALAMICTPPVLLLDEPTAGVDPLSRRSIWQSIASCKRRHNCSVIISSHAMEECETICDRIALMANGNLYCLGSFQQLRRKYSQGYVVQVQLQPNKELGFVAPNLAIEVTNSLKTKIDRLKVNYASDCTIIYRIVHPNMPRSRLFNIMEGERKRHEGQLSYLISDTSLEDVFLTFARGFGTESPKSDTETSEIVIEI